MSKPMARHAISSSTSRPNKPPSLSITWLPEQPLTRMNSISRPDRPTGMSSSLRSHPSGSTPITQWRFGSNPPTPRVWPKGTIKYAYVEADGTTRHIFFNEQTKQASIVVDNLVAGTTVNAYEFNLQTGQTNRNVIVAKVTPIRINPDNSMALRIQSTNAQGVAQGTMKYDYVEADGTTRHIFFNEQTKQASIVVDNLVAGTTVNAYEFNLQTGQTNRNVIVAKVTPIRINPDNSMALRIQSTNAQGVAQGTMKYDYVEA